MPNPSALAQQFLDLLHADSLEQLCARTQAAVQAMDFDHFMFGGTLPAGNGGLEEVLLGTYPATWVERYRQEQYHLVDPCFEHLRRHVHPIPWSWQLFAAPKAAAFFEEARSYGISAGAISPQPCPPLGLFGFGIARDEDPDAAYDSVLANLPHIHLLGSYFLEAFKRHRQAGPVPTLTRRELQCLQWAAQGLRDVDIAGKIHIAARTVLFHLNNARRKLNADNRSQMIARAIALGLISP